MVSLLRVRSLVCSTEKKYRLFYRTVARFLADGDDVTEPSSGRILSIHGAPCQGRPSRVRKTRPFLGDRPHIVFLKLNKLLFPFAFPFPLPTASAIYLPPPPPCARATRTCAPKIRRCPFGPSPTASTRGSSSPRTRTTPPL